MFLIASIYTSIGLGSFFFEFLIFTLFKSGFCSGLKIIFVIAVGDSAKRYKMAIFKPKPTKFLFFWPSLPAHTGLICVQKNLS
jgi:hypothetical protein